jgi:hypothetical protein
VKLAHAALFLVLLAVPRLAAADDPPFTIGPQARWFVLGGVTTGGTVALADRGALVGGELSVARVRDASYFGFYADGYYDWGADGTYATGGIELGKRIVGLDAGAALRHADGQNDVGFAGRVTLGIGVFGIYVRYMHFDSMTADNVLQAGLLVKLPLATLGGS